MLTFVNQAKENGIALLQKRPLKITAAPWVNHYKKAPYSRLIKYWGSRSLLLPETTLKSLN